MELNEEQIKKALDWLDSLVGNSNDSERAMFTYQLLGILYDTCEELTEQNEKLKMFNKLHEQDVADMHEMLEKKVEEVYPEFMRDYQLMREELDGVYEELKESREDNADLHASCTGFERKCASLNDENERLRVECIKWQGRLKIECGCTEIITVRKMKEKVKQAICDNTYPDFDKEGKPVNVWKATTGYDVIDQIAKEMLEGKNER